MTPENVYRKVDGLLNKTIENGASKEEAENALNLAHSLLAKYNLTLKGEEPDVYSEYKTNSKQRFTSPFFICIPLATMTQTVVSSSREQSGTLTVRFFGKKYRTDYAVYLMTIISTIVRVETDFHNGNKLAFRKAMYVGLMNKINRINTNSNTKRLPGQAETATKKVQIKTKDFESFSQGLKTGSEVNLNRPIQENNHAYLNNK